MIVIKKRIQHKEKIGVVGLGKLGLPMLACFLNQGFDTYGHDNNTNHVKNIIAGNSTLIEPGLDETIFTFSDSWRHRFYFDINDLIKVVDFLFVIVPTPTIPGNSSFDTTIIKQALEDICKSSKKISKPVTCVITSTVNPGDCDKFSLFSNNLSDGLVKVVYSPEFIALGSVMKDMLNPDIVLLGGNDDQVVDPVFSIYSRLYKTYPEFHRLSFIEAEIAKVSINSYVTSKISFANMVGMLAERMTGDQESSQRVLNAIGGDKRIGRKYFKFGGGFGGPCFPRDNKALGHYLKTNNLPEIIPQSTEELNDFMLEYWLHRIHAYGSKIGAIIFVGIAYKEGTDFLEESFALKLANKLKNEYQIYVYDEFVDSAPGLHRLQHGDDPQLRDSEFALIIHNYGKIPENLLKTSNQILSFWS